MLTCQLACNDRCFWVQFLDQVDMPFAVQRQVRSLCGDVVDTPVVAQTQIPMVRFTTEILQLQYIDKAMDVCCAGPQFVRSCGRQSRSHSCSSFLPRTRSLTCPLCSTTGAGCRSAENCEGPAVAAHSTRWSMSLLAQFIDKIWTSCDHAATLYSGSVTAGDS